MADDPHDKFDGWRWSHTPWLMGDSDPCDEWPYIMIGGKFVSFVSSFTLSLRHYSDRLKHG